MAPYRIPFNRPTITGNELQYVSQAIDASWLSGDGPFNQRCAELLESALGVERALLTTSCTHALEMAALLLDLGPGDEFVVPSFAFVTTASAFALRGARPIFIDVRPDTLNLDEDLLGDRITPRTRAIVVLHYAGVGCEMDAVLKTAREADVPVVEDNAHGLFGRYKEGWLGTFGCLATQSFHETKNLTCGEGGALIVNRPELIERAEILREKGTNRTAFSRGQVDKYTWVDLGSSYLLAELLAAFLYAQLEARHTIQARRAEIWRRYRSELGAWASDRGIGLPQPPAHCDHPHHMFFLVMPSLAARQAMTEHLRAHGVHAVFHYQPLHLSAMGRRFGGRPGDCPVAERLGDCLLRLPFHTSLSDEEQMEVIEAVRKFRSQS